MPHSRFTGMGSEASQRPSDDSMKLHDSMLSAVQGTYRAIGRRRNEDAICVVDAPHYVIYTVFDGVGSAPDAYEAVKMAVSFIKRHHGKHLLPSQYPALNELFFDLHSELLASSLSTPLAAFLSLCVPRDSSQAAYYSGLGDVRLYAVSANYLKQLSIDDSLSRNVITKCLGAVGLNRSHFTVCSVPQHESRLLVCSDGFYTIMDGLLAKMHSSVAMSSLPRAKAQIDAMIEGHNHDDSTYVIVNRHVQN